MEAFQNKLMLQHKNMPEWINKRTVMKKGQKKKRWKSEKNDYK